MLNNNILLLFHSLIPSFIPSQLLLSMKVEEKDILSIYLNIIIPQFKDDPSQLNISLVINTVTKEITSKLPTRFRKSHV